MHDERPLWRREWRSALLWVTTLAAALALLALVTRQLAREHLRDDAEAVALRYAEVVVTTVPGIDALLAGAAPGGHTLDQLRRLRQVGEIFRFKLFDREGRQLLVSDDLDRPAIAHPVPGTTIAEHQRSAQAQVQSIVLGGRSHIALKSGAGQADRPAWYSEAYVPLVRDGRVLGVVEVYVDQTRADSGIRHEYGRVALTVAALMLLLAVVAGWQGWRYLTAQRRAEQRVDYLAQHDQLSGTLNRASFHDALERAAQRSAAGGAAFAVLCIDLDHFKDVNEMLGHAAGDDVLRAVAQRLRELVRHDDEIARLGADEFAVLQSGVAGPADVSRLAERIVERLAEPHALAGGSMVCAGSVGAAVYGSDATTVADLLHKADLALVRAKGGGRGRFSFYDAALDRQLQTQRALAHDLREAIASESLQLRYQPLFGARDRALVGYEALLRWTHPERGAISPTEFIPIAETQDLIEPLGRWVLHQACRQAAAWPEPLTVAVNLSAAQFRRDDLVAMVAAALAESGLPARRLELEITESLLMHDTDRILGMLQALSALGVRIAMDDFGTGYSSLSYLWRFPFHKVKIDRSFTQGLDDDPKVELIVRSIVSLAHAMAIRVNAEGVETAAQMERLRRYGCDELQGFLLGRPASPESLVHADAARGSAALPPARSPATMAGDPTVSGLAGSSA